MGMSGPQMLFKSMGIDFGEVEKIVKSVVTGIETNNKTLAEIKNTLSEIKTRLDDIERRIPTPRIGILDQHSVEDGEQVNGK